MTPQVPELRDIHLPPAPGWWPPAPGWWGLAVLGVLAVTLAIVRLRRAVRRRRRHALVRAELTTIRENWRVHRDDARLAAEVSAFLRRLSLAADPRSVSLGGAEWLAFLARHGDDFAPFAAGLLEAPFRRTAVLDGEGLLAVAGRHTQRVLDRELTHV